MSAPHSPEGGGSDAAGVQFRLSPRAIPLEPLGAAAVMLLLWSGGLAAADLRWDTAQQFGAVSVRDRAYAAYQPDGLKIGNYLMFPEVGLSTTWDDNVTGVTGKFDKKIADFRHELSTVVKLESHLPRHMLDFMIGAKYVSFQRNDHMEHLDGFATVRWRLDIDHAHSFTGYASSELAHVEELGDERPSSARNAPQVIKNKAEAAFKRDAGRLYASVGALYQSWNYSDATTFSGANVDLDSRDAWIISPFVRWGYRVSPGYKIVGDLIAHHQENRGGDGIDRDARGLEGLVGTEFEITSLLKATLKAGYRGQNYRQATLDDIYAPVWEGRLQWLITPMVTLSFHAKRSIFATTYGDSSGRLDSTFGAKVEYEMWRNLIVTGLAEYRSSDFIGSNRVDELYVGRLSAEYAHTKNLFFTFEYEHQNRQSNLSEFEVTKNKVMVGAKWRF